MAQQGDLPANNVWDLMEISVRADLAVAVVLCIIHALFLLSSHCLAPGNALSSQCLSDVCSLSTQLPDMLALASELSFEPFACLTSFPVGVLPLENLDSRALVEARADTVPAWHTSMAADLSNMAPHVCEEFSRAHLFESIY